MTPLELAKAFHYDNPYATKEQALQYGEKHYRQELAKYLDVWQKIHDQDAKVRQIGLQDDAERNMPG